MQKFSIQYGQKNKSEALIGMIDMLPHLEQIDVTKGNPYFVINHANENYIQAMRTPYGYIVECRYLFYQETQNKNQHKNNSKDGNNLIHYRAWNHRDHDAPGKADPRTGEWGPWIHEHDHISLEQAAALLDHYIILCGKPELPVAAWIHWRDVTEEFPEYET